MIGAVAGCRPCRPIPFSAPMVRAERAGLKTHTRRIPKLHELQPSDTRGYDWTYRDRRMLWHDISHERLLELAPYQVGDHLWVREPLRPWLDPVSRVERVTYDADESPARNERGIVAWPWKVRYLASRYCPRWASRTTLEVLSVRVERVQDITGRGVLAEGVDNGRSNPSMGARWENQQRMAFAALWDELNAARGHGWESNPWVWVIAFKRIEEARRG